MGTVRFFRNSTQLFRHQIPTEFLLLGIVEFLALMLALYLGLEVRYMGDEWTLIIGSFPLKAVVFAAVMQMCLIATGVYQRQIGRFIDVLVLRIGAGLLLGVVPLGLGYYFAPMFFLGRGVLAIATVFGFLLISVNRMFYRRVIRERNMWPRVLILGSGDRASLVSEAIKSGELKGVNIISYVAMPSDHDNKNGIDQYVLDEPLIKYVEEKGIDEIVLAVDERRTGLPSRDLLECKMSGIDVLDLVGFFERRAGKIRLDLLYPSWLYLSDGFRESTFRRLGKRMFDLAIVLLMLPVALPLMLLAALAIFIESGGKGSVFYKQNRVMEENRPFQIYKFRSMVTGAEEDGVARWAAENDPRITRVGSVLRKGRLDELPQLINILKGDMSFVGPRPERPEFVALLAEKIPYYEERLRVKPGLTGWAQINYPYGNSQKDAMEKLQYDLYYVKNYSILLDLLIMLRTAEVVLLGKGAH
ncbi:MAG: TIGR03013 family XrtA/PEP-CTERM system glycosyltransferase [Gammaproteobacteria bacterium]